MPWINKQECAACGICVDACPAGAISIVDDSAELLDDACIKCGTCHDI